MVIAPVLSAFLVLPLADAAPAVAAPVADATAVVKPAEKAKPAPFPLSGSVSVTNTVGSATFAPASAAYANPTIGTAITFSPSAKLAKDWSLSLNQSIGIEWTDSDSATYARQLELTDLSARVSYSGLKWEDLNLSLGLSGGYSLPISMVSRAQGSVGPVSVAGRLTWALDSIGLKTYASLRAGYNLAFAGLAARFANTEVRGLNDFQGNPLNVKSCIVRDQSELDNFACTGTPTGASYGVGLGAGYTPPVLDSKLSFALDLGYNAGFSTYTVWEEDELTAENAAVGLVPRQVTTGNVSASYQATDWLVLTGGAQSGQPPYQLDTVTPRFPLWDFVSPGNNFSSLYVDANFSF